MIRKILLAAATLILIAPATFAATCESVTLDDLTITSTRSRVTIGAGRPGAFYIEIRSGGAGDEALTGIATPAAGMSMLHEAVVKDCIASMPHAARIPVPAGQAVKLEPGGYHGMLMDLTAALNEGKTLPVTLTFEKAGQPAFTFSSVAAMFNSRATVILARL